MMTSVLGNDPSPSSARTERKKIKDDNDEAKDKKTIMLISYLCIHLKYYTCSKWFMCNNTIFEHDLII